MIIKKIFITLTVGVLLSSCASNGTKKNTNKGSRYENVSQVGEKSAEMINVKLGVGYLQRGNQGDDDVALEKFKKAIRINPKFALAYSMLANVYDRKGLFDSAEISYKNSIKYNNGNPDIINNYANFLCQRESYELAIKKYLIVIANPQYKTPEAAYENAGVCATKANKISQAEGFFRKALDINSKLPNSLYYLMLASIENNNLMKARAFLQRLEQVVQPSSEILAAGYKIEKGLNNIKNANKYKTLLKKRFPGSKALKNI